MTACLNYPYTLSKKNAQFSSNKLFRLHVAVGLPPNKVEHFKQSYNHANETDDVHVAQKHRLLLL